jgi:hypothetical protein
MDLFSFLRKEKEDIGEPRRKGRSAMAEEAYRELFPDKEPRLNFYIKYSDHFNSYNANVRMHGGNLTFHFSKKWKTVSKEIQMGLMQELIAKLFKSKKKTMNMDLYKIFLKNVHIAIPKTKNDPTLEASFNRMNDMFFFGMMERPNLQWGSDSTGLLGRYEYGSDTITMSMIFQNSDQKLLDYVMYHEMLHKKFKFESKNGRTVHHSKEFRTEEAKYPNQQQMEDDLKRLARKHRYGNRSFFGF